MPGEFRDLIGSELTLSTKSFRRQAATRRGLVTGVGNLLAQKSLRDACDWLTTPTASGGGGLELYHPNATSLPLDNVTLRRVGADRVEYVAEYRHGGDADQGRVDVSYELDGVVMVPFASEIDSGRRWTPNELPPFDEAKYSLMRITRTVQADLTTAQGLVDNASAIGKINSNATSIGGMSFPAKSLRFLGADISYSTSQTSDVLLRYQLEFRRVQLAGGAVGFRRGRYRKISSRPYWEAEYVDSAPSVIFAIP